MAKSKGLGDTVEKITTATGIKKVVDIVAKKTKKDCGCERRKDKLNKMFPYNKNENLSSMSKDKRIFVQLASYRDPQLVPTMRDALAKANNPQNLFFGICWQKADVETLEEFTNHPQVRYQTYHYTESEGLGWARAKVAELWKDEPFTLQLDSHHRFAKGWDTMMFEDYIQANTISDKPIISTYLTPFEVKNHNKTGDKGLNQTPSLMSQYEFSADKLLMSMPWYIQDYKDRNKVIKSRTISGHFLFTKSEFLKEVPYDPDIYFGGYCEEATMSVRAWTHGYDIFSPYRQYIWHEYTRADRPKHWDDHGKESLTQKTSGERDVYGRKKTRQLFEQEDNGIIIEEKFGLGKVRTLREYEEFTGIDFKGQRIQEHTLKVNEPPNTVPFEEGFRIPEKVKTVIEWDPEHFKSQSEQEYKFITLGVLSSSGVELVRTDFTPETHRDILSYQINSTTVEVPDDKLKGLKILMYGMKQDDTWSTPYEKVI